MIAVKIAIFFSPQMNIKQGPYFPIELLLGFSREFHIGSLF